MLNFLQGGIFVASLSIAAFFFRYWQTTKDQLFFYFGASFLILAAERYLAVSEAFATEGTPLIYLCRLGAFTLIIWAIIQRNRRG